MINKYSIRTLHALIVVLVLCVFLFQLWLSSEKKYAQFFEGYDFPNYVTLGRQLVEFGTLPTFLFPGKSFDGPVKPFSTYYPGLIFGYHEFIPVLMVAVNATLISLLCFFLGCLMFSRRAGLIAMVLSGFQEPYIIRYIFRYAYGFDCMVLFSLTLAVCCAKWVQDFRSEQRQPGLIFCAITGLAAGLAWYVQPVCAAAIIAAGFFLLFSMGTRIFTWRLGVVTISSIIGSLPFWLYYLAGRDVHSSWQGYAVRYSRTMDVFAFLFSREGYPYFLLSPSGESVGMRGFILAAIIMLAAGMVRYLPGLFQRCLQKGWRACMYDGIDVPVLSYFLFIILSMGVIIFVTSGMAQASAGWCYGIELWFWLVVAGSGMVDRLWGKSKVGGPVLLIFALFVFGLPSMQIIRQPVSNSFQNRWENVNADASELHARGHRAVLADKKEAYTLFALGPSGLAVSASYGPWVSELAEIVEHAGTVAVMAALNSANLGSNAWDVLELRTGPLLYNFRMPDEGRAIASTEWSVVAANEHDASGCDLIQDNCMSSSWVMDDLPDFEIVFDKARTVCRLVFMLNREGDDWPSFSYPRDMLITGKLPSGAWVVMAEGVKDDGYFWDTGRIFFALRYRNRLDVRFSQKEVTAIRIQDRDEASKRQRRITELYVFESANEYYDSLPVAELTDFINERGVKRVLADRFVSALVASSMSGVEVWKSPCTSRKTHLLPNGSWPWFPGFEAVEGDNTLIVCSRGMAEVVSGLLLGHGFEFEKIDFGAWVGYMPGRSNYTNPSDLVWNGISVATYFYKQASGYVPVGPVSQPENRFLSPVVFGDVASLIGVDFDPRTVARGESVSITYYWRIPDRWNYVYRRPMVFSHLVNGGSTLNADHRLLVNYDHKHLYEVLDDEIFIQRQIVNIPEATIPGSYTLRTGVHFSGSRVLPKTTGRGLKVRKKALVLNGVEVK